jgi:hypothetical protein
MVKKHIRASIREILQEINMYKATEAEMTECVTKIEEAYNFCADKLQSPEVGMNFLFFTVATLMKEAYGEDQYIRMCKGIPDLATYSMKDSQGFTQ